MSKRILILSDINSAHTRKWCLALASRGMQVGLFSLSKSTDDWYSLEKNIKTFSFQISRNAIFAGSTLGKLYYLKALPFLFNVIKEFKPTIVHAHYASSYGLLGALSKFKPFVVSVWGSDVYDFPKKSYLHTFAFKFTLSKATRIFSTSRSMQKEIGNYTSKSIDVTPFGIDLNVFDHKPVERTVFKADDIVIGTVKSIEKKYGIDYLIQSFEILKKRYPELPLKLLIVGGGSLLEELRAYVDKAGLTNDVVFTGKVKQDLVADMHRMLDVYVSLSVDDSESFGVAALEAGACEKPVVVSDVSGFKEVVLDGKTGFVVKRKDALEAANAIERLLKDRTLLIQLGKNGRAHVEQLYDWRLCVDRVMNLYNEIS